MITFWTVTACVLFFFLYCRLPGLVTHVDVCAGSKPFPYRLLTVAKDTTNFLLISAEVDLKVNLKVNVN